MKMIKTASFLIVMIFGASFASANMATESATVPPPGDCPSDVYSINIVQGRDCVAFDISGTDIASYDHVVYTITFTDNSTGTYTIYDSSTGFRTQPFGYNCFTKTPASACASAVYTCVDGTITTPDDCLTL